MHIYRCVTPSGAQSLRKSTEAILIKDMDKKESDRGHVQNLSTIQGQAGKVKKVHVT